MKRRRALLLASLGLSLLAAGLWAWQDHRAALRRQRMVAWQEYLRGPLSDLLMGSSRGRALLTKAQKAPLSAAERKELAEAVGSVRKADAGARTLLPNWQSDAFFKSMLPATGWHAELADAASDWGRLAVRERSLIPPALDSEAAMRRSLAGDLRAQREAVLERLRPSKDQVLEMNAMLYSLKE